MDTLVLASCLQRAEFVIESRPSCQAMRRYTGIPRARACKLAHQDGGAFFFAYALAVTTDDLTLLSGQACSRNS